MGMPKAYDPQEGYRYQILVMCPGERSYEHCDYAKTKRTTIHLLENYQQAYGPRFGFRTILLPRKYWPHRAPSWMGSGG